MDKNLKKSIKQEFEKYIQDSDNQFYDVFKNWLWRKKINVKIKSSDNNNLKAKGSYSGIKITSQWPFCPNCFSLDLYNSCLHWCKYCFAYLSAQVSSWHNKDFFNWKNLKVWDIEEYLFLMYIALKHPESANEIFTWQKTQWIIRLFAKKHTIHLWGNSDPFSSFEIAYKLTLMLLKMSAMLEYPLIISTKCDWLYKEEFKNYQDCIIKNRNNILLQIFLCSTDPLIEKIEPWTTVKWRLNVIQWALDNDINLVIRCQPFIPFVTNWPYFQDYIDTLWNMTGKNGKKIHWVVVEFLKVWSMWKWNTWLLFASFETVWVKMKEFFDKYTVKEWADFSIISSYKKTEFEKIRDALNRYGIQVFCWENELRVLGAWPNCCWVTEDIWFCKNVSKKNLNHLIFEMKNNPWKKYYWEDFMNLDKENNLIWTSSPIFYWQVINTLERNNIDYKKSTFDDALKHYWDKAETFAPNVFFHWVDWWKDYDGRTYYYYSEKLFEENVLWEEFYPKVDESYFRQEVDISEYKPCSLSYNPEEDDDLKVQDIVSDKKSNNTNRKIKGDKNLDISNEELKFHLTEDEVKALKEKISKKWELFEVKDSQSFVSSTGKDCEAVEIWLKTPNRFISSFEINDNTPIEYIEKDNIWIKREDEFLRANDEQSESVRCKFSKPRWIQELVMTNNDKIFLTHDTKVSKAGLGITNLINKYIENNNSIYAIVNVFLSHIENYKTQKDARLLYNINYMLDNFIKILRQRNSKIFLVKKSWNAGNLLDWAFKGFFKDLKEKCFNKANFIEIQKWLKTPEAVYWNYKQLEYTLENQVQNKWKKINIFVTIWSLTIGSGLALYIYDRIYKNPNHKYHWKINLIFCDCWMWISDKLVRIWNNANLIKEKWIDIDKNWLQEFIYNSWYIKIAEINNNDYFVPELDNEIRPWLKLNLVYEAKWYKNMLAYLENHPEKKDEYNLFWMIWSE